MPYFDSSFANSFFLSSSALLLSFSPFVVDMARLESMNSSLELEIKWEIKA